MTPALLSLSLIVPRLFASIAVPTSSGMLAIVLSLLEAADIFVNASTCNDGAFHATIAPTCCWWTRVLSRGIKLSIRI